MLSIRDYAASKGITYEAVRQSIKRYENDLEGHIFIQGRTKFLDEYAVDFLSQKRAANPIVIYEVAKDEEIERLKNELSNLQTKVTILQDTIIKEREAALPLKQALQAAEVEKEKAVSAAIQKVKHKSDLEKEKLIAESEERLRELKETSEAQAQAASKQIEKAEKAADEAAKRAAVSEQALADFKALPWWKKIFLK